MQDLSQPEWTLRLQHDDNAVIMDVRTQEEVEEGMIPNALHHDIHQAQDFMNALEALDKTKSYFVYCRSGGRSTQACNIMDQMGFENTYNLQGGYSEWAGDVYKP